MNEPLKPDADEIVAHIRDLENQPWLPQSQRRWPRHLFHFTNLDNAVKILTDGNLYSRSFLQRDGGLSTDIASPEIIAQTLPQWQDYVRLYFRPRTPTQYRNEGFRPVGRRERHAHCPLPIGFIFDAASILTRQSTLFSDGSLAANVEPAGTASRFRSLPFQKIYHDNSLGDVDEATKRNIIYHRHAEVIVPRVLDLTALRFVYCRSQAEFETFRCCLPAGTRSAWSGKIGMPTSSPLFFRYWTFVERAVLDRTRIVFTWNSSRTPGPFAADLAILEAATGKTYRWQDPNCFPERTRSFSLSNLSDPGCYTVELRLDGDLAYKNTYLDESELPF